MCSTFVYMLKAYRHDLINNASPEEEKIIDMHFEHLKKALHEGILILAGPCLDGEFGIVIFRAGSEEEANVFMNSDPAVKAGLMSAELHPFRVSLSEKS
jgi:uncharacterized protein YciI